MAIREQERVATLNIASAVLRHVGRRYKRRCGRCRGIQDANAETVREATVILQAVGLLTV